jgi:hypothetical protein
MSLTKSPPPPTHTTTHAHTAHCGVGTSLGCTCGFTSSCTPQRTDTQTQRRSCASHPTRWPVYSSNSCVRGDSTQVYSHVSCWVVSLIKLPTLCLVASMYLNMSSWKSAYVALCEREFATSAKSCESASASMSLSTSTTYKLFTCKGLNFSSGSILI